MANETRQEKKISLPNILSKTAVYSLAFEGAMRITEANLPPEYAEMARSTRYAGEVVMAIAGGCALGISPFLGLALYLYNYDKK